MENNPASSSWRNTLKPVIGYFGATFSLGMVISSLGPTLPSLALITGSSMAAVGILFSARSLGYLLGSLYFGRTYDRLPGNRLLTSVLFIAAVSMALVPISPFLAFTAVLLFIAGLSLGGIDVGSNTLTVWQYQDKAGPYLNALFLFSGIGGFIVPLLVGRFLTAGLDVHGAYWILSLLILPPAIWLLTQPSPSPRKVEVLKEQAKRDNIPLILLLGALFFIYVGAEVSYGGWIYTYTLSSDLGDISTASLLNSLFWFSLTIGRLIAIPISVRIRPELVLRINLVAALISLGVILLWSHSLLGIGIGTFGFGFSLASNFPMTFSLAKRHLNITGRLTGQLWALGSLGAILTPWLIGNLIERFSPIALITTLFFYMCGGLFLLLITRLVIRNKEI